jgi:hypothetical protein
VPKALPLPDRSVLLAHLSYDRRTGVVTRLFDPNGRRSTNSRFAGKPTGTLNGEGYLSLRLGQGRYLVHRIIFKMETGIEPPEVDHWNLDRSDNRWRNLRAADTCQNRQNCPSRANKCGYRGVYASKGMFQSKIQDHGERVYLGSFPTASRAARAYRRAARLFHGEFARI